MKQLTRLRPDPTLLLLFAFCLPLLAPLLAPGYFYDAHDGRHSVFYLIQFDASLRDGAWWPRWAMHHIQGYGYPTFLIQAPLGLYLGEIFVLLGAGFTLAAKLSWAVGVLAGAWGMYALVQHWLRVACSVGRGAAAGGHESSVTSHQSPVTSHQSLVTRDSSRTTHHAPRTMSLAALVAALLYTYFPYHVADLYVRGALNDSLLLGWLPWLFLVFDRLLLGGATHGWPRRLGVAMLVLAGTLLTHTFALLSIAPLLVTFVIFRLVQFTSRRRKDTPGRVAPAVILSELTPDPTLVHEASEGSPGRRWDGLPWQAALLAAAAGAGALLLSSIFLVPLLAEGRFLQQQVYVTDTYDFRNHFVQLGQYFSPFWGFGYSDDPLGANDGMSFQLGAMLVILGIVALFVVPKARRARAEMLYLLAAGGALLLLMTPLAKPLWEALPPLAVIQFPWRLLALAGFTFSALGGLAAWNLAPPPVTLNGWGRWRQRPQRRNLPPTVILSELPPDLPLPHESSERSPSRRQVPGRGTTNNENGWQRRPSPFAPRPYFQDRPHVMGAQRTMKMLFLCASAPLRCAFPATAVTQRRRGAETQRKLGPPKPVYFQNSGLTPDRSLPHVASAASPHRRAAEEAAAGLLLLAFLAIFASWPYLQARLSPVEPWREDGRAIFRFEQEHPDMIAYTNWVREPFTTTAMTADYAAPDYAEVHGKTTSLTRFQILEGTGQVIEQESRGSSATGRVVMTTRGQVQINFFYFPGWQVTVDGQPGSVGLADPTGALAVAVPAGTHVIDARFGATPPRTIGALLSGLTLVLALALLFFVPSRLRVRKKHP